MLKMELDELRERLAELRQAVKANIQPIRD